MKIKTNSHVTHPQIKVKIPNPPKNISPLVKGSDPDTPPAPGPLVVGGGYEDI